MNAKNTIVAGMCVLFLVVSVSTAAVQDVGLPNASLENWTSGNADDWTKDADVTWSQDTNYVVDGTYSMNVYGLATDRRSIYQGSAAVTAGALYDGRFYCNAVGNSGHSSGYIRWYDSAGASLGDSSITTKGGPYTEISAGARHYYESVRAPSNAVKAGFVLSIHCRGSANALNIDDIQMRGGAPVTALNETIETRNAGLEDWDGTTVDGWTVADGEKHTGDHKNSGSSSLQINSGAAEQSYSWGEQIIAGDEYEAKLWAYKSANSGHSYGYLTWYDEEYVAISKHVLKDPNATHTEIYSGTRWYSETLTAPTDATRARFSIEGVASDITVCVDDVTLTHVPEPATMVLLGLGGVGLLIRRRRRA